MSRLTRRAVTTGLATAVTIISAVGLSKDADERGEDRLLYLVQRYKAEIASFDGLGDPTEEEISNFQDRITATASEAAGLPCLTMACAVAVLDLVVQDNMLGSSGLCTDEFTEIVASVKDYLAGRVA